MRVFALFTRKRSRQEIKCVEMLLHFVADHPSSFPYISQRFQFISFDLGETCLSEAPYHENTPLEL